MLHRMDQTVQQSPGRLAFLEAVVETSDDAIFSNDTDGTITSWNRSAERIFGYLEEEVVGQRVLVLFPEHLARDAALVIETVTAGDRVDHFETEIQRKDGMPIPISLSLSPVFDLDAKVIALVGVARDITEQRLAQATLAEVEARMRDAEALAQVGGWLWDVRTGAVQWTDALHRIHGVDPRDFEGTIEGHLSLVHADDVERVRAGMQQSVDSGRPFEEEYRVVCPNGQQRWIYARGEPAISSAGAVVGLRGIGQNVTDRRGGASPGGTISSPARPRHGDGL